METNEFKVVIKGEKAFPKALYDLKEVPEKLYVMGNVEILNDFSISVVGARSVSEYRKRYCNKAL